MVASKLCPGPAVALAFTPCLPYFDHKEERPSKACCKGYNGVQAGTKTKADRAAT